MRKNPGEFLEIPERHRTWKVCLAAIKYCAIACRYIPAELQTDDFFTEAVKANWVARKYIPQDHTFNVYLEAAKKKFADEPEESITKEFVLDFLRKNPDAFRVIPEKHRDQEACFIAIESYDSACRGVPAELQTEDFFIEAVKVNADGWALRYIPQEHRRPNVCLAALERHPQMRDEILGYVPENLKANERFRH